MPPGHALFLGWFVLATSAAVAPPTRRGARARYLLAVAVNEVPVLGALVLLAGTAGAWRGGDLRGAGGVVALVVTVLVLVGLGVVAWRAGDAAAHVRSGLRRAGLPAPAATTAGRGWWAPLPLRPRGVVRLRGIAYGEHRRQRVDVYRRRDGVADGRVLLYLHGGGYYSGSRHKEGRALLHRLAAQGWTCVSAGYRLRPRAGFEEHLADARAALRWAHRHALPERQRPRAVVMAGSSAGAHLSALCALDQPDDPDQRVDVAVLLYGHYGRYYGRGVHEDPISTPFGLDPAGAPPVMVVHGDGDSWVPVQQARALHARLRDAGSAVAYVELPGAQHGFDLFASPRCRAVGDGVETFLHHALLTSRPAT